MELPLVSVVIVTWNRKDDLLRAVRSVQEQSYQHVEIVVVDNASTDGTVEALRQGYPSVRLVLLDRNAGAAGGRNPGIVASRGDIVFLLDSDASLAHDTLGMIVDKLRAEPDVGAIACKIVNAYTGKLDRYAGWSFSEKDRRDQDVEFLAYRFSEGGCAIRRQVLERVGLFWDRLFFGREGEELSLRIWDCGYKVLYSPRAIVFHHVPPDRIVPTAEREYTDVRNALYIYLVRYPWWMLIWFVPIRIGASLVRGMRRHHARQTLRALLQVARESPVLWSERKPISNESAKRYLKVMREHGPLTWDLASWLRHKA